MTNTLSKPNIIPGRRNFLKGAAALGGSAAMLAAINDGARAAGDPIPVGQAGQVLLSYGAYRGRARPQTDAKALSVRYDHSLSKRTRLYTGVARIDNDAKAAFAINTASNSGPAGPAGGSPRSVVVGLSHSF